MRNLLPIYILFWSHERSSFLDLQLPCLLPSIKLSQIISPTPSSTARSSPWKSSLLRMPSSGYLSFPFPFSFFPFLFRGIVADFVILIFAGPLDSAPISRNKWICYIKNKMYSRRSERKEMLLELYVCTIWNHRYLSFYGGVKIIQLRLIGTWLLRDSARWPPCIRWSLGLPYYASIKWDVRRA